MPRSATIKRIFVTDGSWFPMKERAIVVYRNNNRKDIDMRNLNDDLFFAQFDITEMNGNIVAVLSDIISKVLGPSVNCTKEWGDLAKTAAGLQSKKDFLGDFEFFSNFLESTPTNDF